MIAINDKEDRICITALLKGIGKSIDDDRNEYLSESAMRSTTAYNRACNYAAELIFL